MSMNPIQGNLPVGPGPVVDFQALRATRQLQLDARVEDATLSPAQQLSPQEIAEQNAYYNGTANDLAALKSGEMNSLIELRERDPESGGMGGLFGGGDDDDAVRRATEPVIFDNQPAAQLRREYRNTYAEARRDLAQAVHIAQKLGPGEQHRANGEDVAVTPDPESGQTTVTTRSKDGSARIVSFLTGDPENGATTRQNSDGTEERLTREGTRVSRAAAVIRRYSIDDGGHPVRTMIGPGADDWEQVTANLDGSTDTRTLVRRDENGQPTYEDTHQDPGFVPWQWQPPIRSNPWRPLTTERYPWEPEPFRMLDAQAQ